MENILELNTNAVKDETIKTWQIYCLLVLGFISVTYLTNNHIMTRGVYHHLMSDQIESYRIDYYFDINNKFSIWSYLSIPILLWLKVSIVAFLIQLPLMIKFIEIKFLDFFRIVIQAQIAILLLACVKVIFLLFIPYSEYTNEILTQIPLSVLSIVDFKNFSPAYQTLLNNINLFELLWIYLLYRGLNNTGKIEKNLSFNISLGMWISLTIVQLGIMLYITPG